MTVPLEIVHILPGRIRLRIPSIRTNQGFSQGLERFIKAQPGILDVRIVEECQSVTVRYDPAIFNGHGPDDLLRALEDGPARLGAEGASGSQPAGVSPHEASKWNLVLSSGTLLLSALGIGTGGPLGLALVLASAFPIFGRAFNALFNESRLTVDVLDTTATAILTAQGAIPTAAFMVWLISLGDFIRDQTAETSRRTIEAMVDYKAGYGWVVRGDQKVQVKADSILEGETVVVYPGEMIPVDGVVLDGFALVDQKTLTGESMPVSKKPGDSVFAATFLHEGKLYLRAEKVGDATRASQIVQIILQAPPQETRIQNYAEKLADDLVPLSFLAAGASYGVTANINRMTSILIIDFGTGIRVAAPTSILASMIRAGRRGMLIKGGRHIEDLSAVDTFVLDKTGTLTTGLPKVTNVIAFNHSFSSREVLSLAAGAEDRLTHPVAEAVLRAAAEWGVPIPIRESSEFQVGLGVEASINGFHVLVGSHRYMEEKGIPLGTARANAHRTSRSAESSLFVAVDHELAGLISYADQLRPEAPAVVSALRERGIRELILVTGDNEAVASAVSSHLGIGRFFADIFPEGKADIVRQLQKEGRKVAFVGDGINDSPALTVADVGISMRGGADVTRETADVVLLEDNLWKIVEAHDISRDAMALIRQNYGLVVAPNAIAIFLSLFGFLNPLGATVISNGSAIAACLNALRPLMSTRSFQWDRSAQGRVKRVEPLVR